MQSKTNIWSVLVAIIITAIVVSSGAYYWLGQSSKDAVSVNSSESEFASLLHNKEFYDLPFGSAEVEGYYSTAMRPTSLDGSTPEEECSAFVITDGPEELLGALKKNLAETYPRFVIGSVNSNWGKINQSTEENPIKVFITLNTDFEGELIGCMAWPFDLIVEAS